jgi:hypothetical protein
VIDPQAINPPTKEMLRLYHAQRHNAPTWVTYVSHATPNTLITKAVGGSTYNRYGVRNVFLATDDVDVMKAARASDEFNFLMRETESTKFYSGKGAYHVIRNCTSRQTFGETRLKYK